MSETLSATETPVAAPVEAAQPVETVAAPVEQAAPEPEPEAPKEPEPPRKPQGDRRFAIMTAKLKAEEAARLAAERELHALRELANVDKADPLEAPKREAPQNIEEAARKLVQQREFDARRQSVIAEGAKEFPDWQERAEIVHGLGATSNPAFMEALVELPNAAKIIAHLSEDADALVALLNKSPTAMAAAMGRLDAEMSRPVTRKLSAAPAPIKPVTTPSVAPEPTISDDNLSMKEWIALRNKQAPRHLGGRGGR